MKKRDLFGYGAATVADSGPYNFVTVYLILFLTTVVSISPERAGTISSLIILADGVTGAFIGYISDYTRSEYGRRRPYLLAAVFPLVIGLSMLFCNFQGGQTLQTVFYIVAGLMFWLGFSMYYTPYTALGAEITDDYNERSVLRTIARLFGIAGNLIGTVMPLLAVSFMQRAGASESRAWFAVAVTVAVVSGAGILVTWRTSRGKEKKDAVIDGTFSLKGLVVEYVRIFRLKPFKYMIVVIAMFIIANTFYNSSMVFFARYSLGIGDEITSSIFMISIIANLALTPVMGYAAVRLGKKNTVAASMLISGAGCIFFYIIGIDSYFMMGLYAVVFSVAYTCFWQLINAVMYDISEVADYKFGKRLEGSISSVYGLVFTIFTSIATQLFGWILKFNFINAAFMLLPGILLLVTAAAQFMYPINEKTFNKLKKALACRKAGEPVDLEGLERIL
ncbi:MAG: MFS transporter [Lentihominibacter sp.]